MLVNHWIRDLNLNIKLLTIDSPCFDCDCNSSLLTASPSGCRSFISNNDDCIVSLTAFLHMHNNTQTNETRPFFSPSYNVIHPYILRNKTAQGCLNRFSWHTPNDQFMSIIIITIMMIIITRPITNCVRQSRGQGFVSQSTAIEPLWSQVSNASTWVLKYLSSLFNCSGFNAMKMIMLSLLKLHLLSPFSNIHYRC